MSQHKIEIGVDKQQSASKATREVSKGLESVKDTIKKTNDQLGVLTRSMQTFERVTGGALRGVSRGFADMFKNANHEADSLIAKMQRMQSLFSKSAPTIFGPNGQVVSGPTPVQPGSQTPGGGVAQQPASLGGGIVGPNGQPVPAGGGNGGNGGGGANTPLGKLPPWFTKFTKGAAIAGAVVSVGADVFDQWNSGSLKELKYNAARAGMGADLRNRLVNGDLSDAYLMMNGANRDQLKNIIGDIQRKETVNMYADGALGALKTGSLVAGAAVLAPVTGGGSLAALAAGGAAMGVGAGGPGQVVGFGQDWYYNKNTASSAEAVRPVLELQKQIEAIPLHTLQQLQGNGQRWARSFRLFSNQNIGGPDDGTAKAGETSYRGGVRLAAHFGVGEQEFGSLQERAARYLGQSRAEGVLSNALGAETTWGMERGTALDALTRLQSGLGDSKKAGMAMDDLIAKGFSKGFKDAKFKEDLAAVIVDYSEAKGGMNGEGALGMANLLMTLAGPNPTALGVRNAREGLDAANGFMGGKTGGAFKTLGFAAAGSVVSMLNRDAAAEERRLGIDPRRRGDLGDQFMLENLDMNQITTLLNGGGDPAVRAVFEANGWDMKKGLGALSRKKATQLLQVGRPGMLSKYGGLEGLLSASQDPKNKVAQADFTVAVETIRQQMGNGLNGEGAPMREAVEAVLRGGINPNAQAAGTVNPWGEANAKTDIETKRIAGSLDGTAAGAANQASANAFLDVMTKISDPTMTKNIEALSGAVEGMAKKFEGMARGDINTADEIEKMTGAIEGLTKAVHGFNNMQNGGYYWTPPQSSAKPQTKGS